MQVVPRRRIEEATAVSIDPGDAPTQVTDDSRTAAAPVNAGSQPQLEQHDATKATDAAPPSIHERRAPHQSASGHGWRRVVVVLLLVLGALLAPVSVIAGYVKTQIEDTDRYVSTVAPLASDPLVQAYVADTVSRELLAQVDVKQYVQDALPDRAQVLAGPISNALISFTNQAALRIIQSDQFQKVWVEANRIGHRQLVKVLTGKGDAVTVSSNGAVTLDLSKVAATVKEQLQATGIDALSKVPLDRVQGEVTVFQSKNLYQARHAVNIVDKLAFILPFIVVACFGGAILLSRDRRRTFIKAAFALTAGVALLAVSINTGRGIYLHAVENHIPRGAAGVFYDTLLRSLHTAVRNGLLISLVVATAASLAGPSRLAVAVRERWLHGIGWIGAEADHLGWGVVSPNGWIRRSRRPLRIAVAVVAFVVAFRWSHPTSAVLFWIVVAAVFCLAVIDFYGRPDDGTTSGAAGGSEMPVTIDLR